MIRKIRFKASGIRKIVKTCPAGQVFKSGQCIVQSAANKLMQRRAARKRKITKRQHQAKETLGIIAMKKAVARRNASGM
jgi:hypothetical protein